MYYILNETNQIVAADEEMLSHCEATHIDALVSKIAKEEIEIHFANDENVILKTPEEEKRYAAKETSLSSLMGHLHLIQIFTDTQAHEETSVTKDEEYDLLGEASSIKKEEKVSSQNSVADEGMLLLSDTEAEEESPKKSVENAEILLLSDTEEEEEISLADHLETGDDIIELKDTDRQKEEETELLTLLSI